MSETNTQNFHLVFVYGSLKSQYWNNDIIARDEENAFIGEATTKDSCYIMTSLGAFPGVHKGGRYNVRGELYLVNDITLARLDMLEGNGHFYTREQVAIEGYDEPAWIYLLPSLDDGSDLSDHLRRRAREGQNINQIKMVDNSIQEWHR